MAYNIEEIKLPTNYMVFKNAEKYLMKKYNLDLRLESVKYWSHPNVY